MTRENLKTSWKIRLAAGVAMLLVAGTVVAPPPAQGTPDPKQERISQLESQIAQNRVKADQAALTVDQSAAAYAQAFDELTAAQATAKQAQQKYQQAQQAAEKAKAKLGLLAVAKYRQDRDSFTDFQTVTETDSFHTQALKQEVTTILGAKADEQIQSLTALKNVAGVLRQNALQAVEGKKDAARKLAKTEQSARAQAQEAAKTLEQTETKRKQIIAELAKAREVSLAQEQARQEKVEAQRRAAIEQAAEKKRQEEIQQAQQLALAKKAEELRQAQIRAQREIELAKQAQEAIKAAKAQADAKAREEAQRAAQQAQKRAEAAQNLVTEVEKKPVTAAPSSAPVRGNGTELLEWAQDKVGLPYIWGGSGPEGYDCSGLVYAGMKEMGRSVARVASGQYSTLANVSYEQKEPGDLIFFSSDGSAAGVYHVGIYAGDGKLLHAPRPGRNIEIVPLYNVNKIMPFVARL